MRAAAKRRWVLGLGASILVGGSPSCRQAEPRDQWLVTVATDAPLPQFGDRLLVEVLRDGELACSACRRIFGVGPDDLPGSFGVAAPEGDVAGLRLRVRLYRTDHTGPDGGPSGGANLDVLGRLPSPSGSTPVSVVATMDCFGVSAAPGIDQSCDPTTGTLGPAPMLADGAALPDVGSWPPAAPVPCSEPVPEDMICIEGGVFLFGSPLHFHLSDELASEPEHLVRLSPFALDRDEVTVGKVRQLVQQGLLPEAPVTPSSDPLSASAPCSYLGPDDPSHDDEPVNCAAHPVAEQICAVLGRRLPTEAEWEFAAGQRDLETTYPWGYDDDVCARAVVAVGRFNEAYQPEPIVCRRLEDGSLGPWGYLVGGSESDVTAQGVRNLGGNLAEWVADRFQAFSSGCFATGETLIADPICTVDGGLGWGYRGSGWAGLPGEAQVFIRQRFQGVNPNIGVRCAMSR